MSFQVEMMSNDHIEDAARMAARLFQALRKQIPLLPASYEKPAQMIELLKELGEWSGAVALEGGRLVGFLCGIPIGSFQGRKAMYSPEWANGAETAHRQRIYEELYTRISSHWVAAGCGMHVISLLCNDLLALECFHRLGFGMAAVDGVRAAQSIGAQPALPVIRQAEKSDLVNLDNLLTGLERFMALAPVFWLHPQESAEDFLGGESRRMWLAFDGDEVVGCMGLIRGYEEGCTVLQDEGTIQIEPAFIREDWRGRGVGKALLNRCLEQAQAEGYVRVAVDFESMNVSAARFWKRWFTPACYSLARSLDPRLIPG